jgi:hypothetical protein
MTPEVQLYEANQKIAELTLANEQLKEAVTRWKRTWAAERLEFLMHQAGLSFAGRERLRAAFRNTTNDSGMRQAVNAEKKLTLKRNNGPGVPASIGGKDVNTERATVRVDAKPAAHTGEVAGASAAESQGTGR